MINYIRYKGANDSIFFIEILSKIWDAITKTISDNIDDMDDIWKLLLLMGIGVFSIHTSSRYTEIMKDLAKSKKLYIIKLGKRM